MIEYYKNKMNTTYTQWEKSTDEKDDAKAKVHMANYLNYKELYEGKLSKS